MARKGRKNSTGGSNYANRPSKKGNPNQHSNRGSNQKRHGHKNQPSHRHSHQHSHQGDHQQTNDKQQGKQKGKNGRQNYKNPIVLRTHEKDLCEVMKHLYADGQSLEQITDSIMKDWRQLLDDLNPDDLPFPDDRDDVRGYMVKYLQSQMLLDDYLRDAPELEEGIMAEIATLRHLPARTIAKNLQDHPKLRSVSYSLSNLSEEARVVRIARAVRNCPDHQWSGLLKKAKDKGRLAKLSSFHRNNPFSTGDEPRALKSSPRDYYGNPIADRSVRRGTSSDQAYGQWQRTHMHNSPGAAEKTCQSPMITENQTFDHWQKMQMYKQSGAPPESRGSQMIVDDQAFGHWQKMQGFGGSNQPIASHRVLTDGPSTAMELDHSPSIREILEEKRKARFNALPKAVFGAPSRFGNGLVSITALPQQTGGYTSTTKSHDLELATNEHRKHQERDCCHACRMEAQSRRRTAETRFEAAAALLNPDEMRKLHEKLILRVPSPNFAPWQHLTGQQMLARLWYSLNRQDRDWCLYEVEEHVKPRRYLIPRLSKFRDSLRLLTCVELEKVAGFLKGCVFPPLPERKLSEVDAVADMWSRVEQIDADIQLHVEQWVRSKPFFRAIHLLENDELDSIWNSMAVEVAPMRPEDRRWLQVDDYEVLTDMWSRMETQRAETCLRSLREHVEDRDASPVNSKRFHSAIALLTWYEASQIYSTIATATREVAIIHWLSMSTPTIITKMWQCLRPKQRGEMMAQVEEQVRGRLPEGKLIQRVHSWMALLTVDEMREFFSQLACDLGTPTPALQGRLSPSLMLAEMWRLLELKKRGEVAEALEDRVRDRMLALPAPAEPVEPSIVDIINSNPSLNTFPPTHNSRSRSVPIHFRQRIPRHVYSSMRGGKFSTDAITALLQLETKGFFDKDKTAESSGLLPDAFSSFGSDPAGDEMQVDSCDAIKDPVKICTPSNEPPGPHGPPGHIPELMIGSHHNCSEHVQSSDRMEIDQSLMPQTPHNSLYASHPPRDCQPEATSANFQSPLNDLNRKANPHTTLSPPYQPPNAVPGNQDPHIPGTPPLHDSSLHRKSSEELHTVCGEPWPLDNRTTEEGFAADDELSDPSSRNSWSTSSTWQLLHQPSLTEGPTGTSTEASTEASASGDSRRTGHDRLWDGSGEQRERKRERGRRREIGRKRQKKRGQNGSSSQGGSRGQSQGGSSTQPYHVHVEDVVDESDEEL